MSINYPNRQTMIIAIVCAVAVLGTIIYVYAEKPPVLSSDTNNINPIADTVGSDSNVLISTSTDWKKQFFGQSSSSISLKNTLDQKYVEASSTLTDKLSQELFARFIMLKQQNLDTNTQLMQDAVDETLSNAMANSGKPQTYSTSHIIKINNPSIGDYMNYGNSVATILLTVMPKDNAPHIAKLAFDQGNMELMSNIDPLINSYKKSIQSLLSIKVPNDMANAHIDLINAISSLNFISQSIRNTQGDPTQSIIALGSYNYTQDAMRTSLLNIQDLFNMDSIVFGINDPGHLFSTITP